MVPQLAFPSVLETRGIVILCNLQFERTLIVAEEDSFISYLEGCTAPSYDKNQVCFSGLSSSPRRASPACTIKSVKTLGFLYILVRGQGLGGLLICLFPTFLLLHLLVALGGSIFVRGLGHDLQCCL